MILSLSLASSSPPSVSNPHRSIGAGSTVKMSPIEQSTTRLLMMLILPVVLYIQLLLIASRSSSFVQATITIIDTQQMYPNTFIDYKQYNTRPFRTSNDYYSRLQSFTVTVNSHPTPTSKDSTPSDYYGMCHYDTTKGKKKDHTIIVPNDGLPVTLLVVINYSNNDTTTSSSSSISTTASTATATTNDQVATSDAASSSSRSLSDISSSSSSSSLSSSSSPCSIYDQIQYTVHNVLPLGRVRYLIIAVDDEVEQYQDHQYTTSNINVDENDDNDIPLYVIQISKTTQQDLLYVLQHSIGNDTLLSGGPQIAINSNHYDGKNNKKNHHHHSSDDNGEDTQTLIYTTLIAFIVSASCCIILLLSSNDWDDDTLLGRNTTDQTAAAAAAANRAVRQKLTKEQVRELLPLYRYNDHTKQLIRVGSTNYIKRLQQRRGGSEDSSNKDASATATTTSVGSVVLDTLQQQQEEEEGVTNNTSNNNDTTITHASPDIINDIDLSCSECSICLDEFGHGDAIRILYQYCQHIYHAKCIGRWLSERSAVCPLCKYNLYVEPPESEDDDDNGNDTNNNTNPSTTNTTTATMTNATTTTSSSSSNSFNIWHRINTLFTVPTSLDNNNNITNNENEQVAINSENNTDNSPEAAIVTPPQDSESTTTTSTDTPRTWAQRMFPRLSSIVQQQQQQRSRRRQRRRGSRQRDEEEVDGSNINMLTEPLLSSGSPTEAAVANSNNFDYNNNHFTATAENADIEAPVTQPTIFMSPPTTSDTNHDDATTLVDDETPNPDETSRSNIGVDSSLQVTSPLVVTGEQHQQEPADRQDQNNV